MITGNTCEYKTRKKNKKNVNIYPITVVIFIIFWFPFHIHDVPRSAFLYVNNTSNDEMISCCFWIFFFFYLFFCWIITIFFTRFLCFCYEFLAEQSIFLHLLFLRYFYIFFMWKKFFPSALLMHFYLSCGLFLIVLFIFLSLFFSFIADTFKFIFSYFFGVCVCMCYFILSSNFLCIILMEKICGKI